MNPMGLPARIFTGGAATPAEAAMSRIYNREYCGQPVPDFLRRYSGECCVLTKGHKSEHRSLGIGNRETVKDVRRIVRKAGLQAPHREATRNWSWISRDGAQVDHWGNQIVRVMWRSRAQDAFTRSTSIDGGEAWRAAIAALLAAGYHVIHEPGHLTVSRRVLRKTAYGYE